MLYNYPTCWKLLAQMESTNVSQSSWPTYSSGTPQHLQQIISFPWIWSITVIIPIFRASKSASNVASYHPICLTSCIVKLLECILADLYYITETKQLFSCSCLWSDFQKGRSCKDQILQIKQAIEDGFQWKSMQQSVLVLLNLSKAYNTVWREKLLLYMLDMGISATIVCWLGSDSDQGVFNCSLYSVTADISDKTYHKNSYWLHCCS